MRVRCVKVINSVTGEETTDDVWLTLHREYPVLEIHVSANRRVSLRIESDDYRTPALFDAAMFVTTSTAIPSN